MPKVVVISGGSQGLGLEICKVFLEQTDYQVCTFSRKQSDAVTQLRNHPRFGNRFQFDVMDVSDSEAVSTYIRGLSRKFGSVDILINNAAIASEGILALQNDEAIDRMLQINLRGSVALAKACVREMLLLRWGRVINISSVVGKSGFKGLAVYSLTKAGLDGFTRSLARELGECGITVNSIAPGFLDTAMSHNLSDGQRQQIIRRTPVGRLGRTEDIIPMILFLCSDQAAFMTGQTIVIDGGLTA